MALDAKTGKLLYQSGDAMKTWNHSGGLAIDDGKIYTVDHGLEAVLFWSSKSLTGTPNSSLNIPGTFHRTRDF